MSSAIESLQLEKKITIKSTWSDIIWSWFMSIIVINTSDYNQAKKKIFFSILFQVKRLWQQTSLLTIHIDQCALYSYNYIMTQIIFDFSVLPQSEVEKKIDFVLIIWSHHFLLKRCFNNFSTEIKSKLFFFGKNLFKTASLGYRKGLLLREHFSNQKISIMRKNVFPINKHRALETSLKCKE